MGLVLEGDFEWPAFVNDSGDLVPDVDARTSQSATNASARTTGAASGYSESDSW